MRMRFREMMIRNIRINCTSMPHWAVLPGKDSDMDFSYLASPEEKCPVKPITNLEESERQYKEKVEIIKKEINKRME